MSDLKEMSKNDLVREVAKLRALLADQMATAPGTGSEVMVEGQATLEGKPFVKVRSGEISWQWTPAQARMHAFFVMDAAVEAERDAAAAAFLRSSGLEDQEIGGFIASMRDHRKDWLEEWKQQGVAREGG